MSVVKWVYYYVLIYNIVYPFPYAHPVSGGSDQKFRSVNNKLNQTYRSVGFRGVSKKTFSFENLLDMCNGTHLKLN